MLLQQATIIPLAQNNSTILQIILPSSSVPNITINNVLTFLTIVAAFVSILLTMKMLNNSITQTKLMRNPMISIEFGRAYLDKYKDSNSKLKWKLGLLFNCLNAGNGPAIEVFTESEIELQYTDINGLKNIPSIGVYNTSIIKINENSMAFWNKTKFSTVSLEKIREDIIKGREKDGDMAKPPIVRIYVYYKDTLNQYFRSVYPTCIDFSSLTIMPDASEVTDSSYYFNQIDTTHSFSYEQITKKEMLAQMERRKKDRDLVEGLTDFTTYGGSNNSLNKISPP